MKILIVEDDFACLQIASVLLSSYGDVDAATNSDQAGDLMNKAIINGKPYDLMVIDINIPGSTGLELLCKFRAAEEQATISPSRKLVMSSVSSHDNIIGAARAKCDGFMVKPLTKDSLTAKLASLGFHPAAKAEV